ncbi:MAG: TetR/AcrR family transcriptional regulator [Candidatus Binataceae bacterium]|nr:TetR/AcrR family transcriptional regulator [Candidatus Binataceae bacterium]
MDREERRAQVLRHAKRIFARKGYHRTNVADIISAAHIARGTFYLYFRNKREIFEVLLDQALRDLSDRIRRIRMAPEEASPIAQLRANLNRVLEFVLTERELTDIVLNHAVGFDRELDARISEFYDQIAEKIQRSLDLGIQMKLVRECDTRTVAACILGVVKEVVAELSRERRGEPEAIVEQMLNFGLRGVSQPELLDDRNEVLDGAAGSRLVGGLH